VTGTNEVDSLKGFGGDGDLGQISAAGNCLSGRTDKSNRSP
jgi:hypothetical protein